VPAGGVITIALELRDDEVRITVADNGPGIPLEAQAHIFERFYRADRARARRDAAEGTGAGLGLAIAKWIAAAHQGRLDLVRSDSTGTIFEAVFPFTSRSSAL
jgi:two-component system OmpR family sensor kinase